MPNGRTRSDQLRTVFEQTQEQAEQNIAAIRQEAEQRITAAKREVMRAAVLGVMGAFLDPELTPGQKKRKMERYVDETTGFIPSVADDLASKMLADGRAAGPTLALGGDVGVGLVTDDAGRTRVGAAAVAEAEPPKKRAYHRRKPSYRGGETKPADDGEHTPLSQVILKNRSGEFQYKDLLKWATTNREARQLIDGIDTGRKTVSGANIAKLEQLIRAHKGEDGDGAGKAGRPAERAGAPAAAAHRKSDDDKSAGWYVTKAAKGNMEHYRLISRYLKEHADEFNDCRYPNRAGFRVYGAMGDEFVRRLRDGAGISQVGKDAEDTKDTKPTRAGAPPVEKEEAAEVPEISRSASVPIGQVFLKAADGSATTARRISDYFWKHENEFGPGDGIYVSGTGDSARVDKKRVKDVAAKLKPYGAPPEEKRHAVEEGPPRTGGAADELRTDGLHRSRSYVTNGPGLELDIFIRQMPAAQLHTGVGDAISRAERDAQLKQHLTVKNETIYVINGHEDAVRARVKTYRVA